MLSLVAAQSLLVYVFVRALLSDHGDPTASGLSWPRTAVVVCLRGSDPFLADNLRAVLDQDYPDYSVHIVVDSPDDPAWDAVRKVVAQFDAQRVRVTTLEERKETCSLKCSSIVQVVSRLDDSYEVVALADADTSPHRTWLKELVMAMADDDVGAATGNRWYMPSRSSVGAVERYLWNAAAVVQMFCYSVPWGGTLAIKREVFRKCNLLER